MPIVTGEIPTGAARIRQLAQPPLPIRTRATLLTLLVLSSLSGWFVLAHQQHFPFAVITGIGSALVFAAGIPLGVYLRKIVRIERECNRQERLAQEMAEYALESAYSQQAEKVEHSHRVASYVHGMSKALGLDQRLQAFAYVTSLLHELVQDQQVKADNPQAVSYLKRALNAADYSHNSYHVMVRLQRLAVTSKMTHIADQFDQLTAFAHTPTETFSSEEALRELRETNHIAVYLEALEQALEKNYAVPKGGGKVREPEGSPTGTANEDVKSQQKHEFRSLQGRKLAENRVSPQYYNQGFGGVSHFGERSDLMVIAAGLLIEDIKKTSPYRKLRDCRKYFRNKQNHARR